MKALLQLIALILIAVFPAYADETKWVIGEKVTGKKDLSTENITLFPSERVKVVKVQGDMALISRVDEQPGYETSDSESNEKAKQPVWVEKKLLVSVEDFRKVENWSGPAEWGKCWASCDAGIGFIAKPNGSFTATLEATGGGPGTDVKEEYKGHLYRYKNIIWAMSETSNEFTDGNLFIEVSASELRDYVEVYGMVESNKSLKDAP